MLNESGFPSSDSEPTDFSVIRLSYLDVGSESKLNVKDLRRRQFCFGEENDLVENSWVE